MELWCKFKGYTPHHALWNTQSDVGQKPFFVICISYIPVLYPSNWITCCWFCCTAADWNILLWIYMMWCYSDQLSASGRFGLVPKEFHVSQVVFFSPSCKERHNITACICMERKKNPWFECNQRYCNRPCTYESQVMHNLKRYQELRCIDSDQECLRQQWRSHWDQHYESGISDSLPWMHNHHAQTIMYQPPYDCKEQEDLHHVCLSWGHLYLACCDHPFVCFCMVSQYAWKGTQMGRLYFCSHWEIRAKCVVHALSATICWFPCLIESWLASTFRLYSSQVSIHTISH